MTITPIRVFVYGTLKTGEPNHKVLSETDGCQKFIGTGKTIEKFPLVIGTKYNIPFLLNQPGQGNEIEGEVYEIDEKKLEILDELEAYPTLYDRKIVEIRLSSDDSIITAYLYLIKKWRPDLLATSTEMITNYSSSGSHGRPYVERYVRAKEILDSDDGSSLYEQILGADLSEELVKNLDRKKANFDLN